MHKVGIDTISFYTSHYFFDLAHLATLRGIDPDKYAVGLGQYQMAVPPPGEDIVTMAANAAQRAIRDIDPESIEMVLFATESGVDQSKAAGIYVHDLLKLPARCRVVELKQACYSATCGLQLALPFLQQNPHKKVLLIASDIARYGLGTPGEPSQGCGAVAMILSVNPRILALEPECGICTENVMDFWRPNYSDKAFVEGKYSSKLYLNMLEKSWNDYQTLSRRSFEDHSYFCYHTPVSRLVEKAHQLLVRINDCEKLDDAAMQVLLNPALKYGRTIGNSYTASLYVSLTSLLDTIENDLSGKRIGFYSYGSGCMAEYFSGVVQAGYRDVLDTAHHQTMLAHRERLTSLEYEAFYSFDYPQDGSHCEIPLYETGKFRLTALRDHKRVYEQVVQPTEAKHAAIHAEALELVES